MNQYQLLIVEDDIPVQHLIMTTLKAHGYHYHTASNGEEAVLETASFNPDIVLLDLGLPDLDGVDVIKRIRSWSNVPIIVISARSEDTDKITALDAGADDYLTKPFSVDELLARIRVTQRRLELMNGAVSPASTYENGQLFIDYAAGCVTLHGQELHLTAMEYKLLCLLAQNTGKVLTHRFILENVWGSTLENDVGTLRVFMATLRKKLESTGTNTQYIQTHIGIGYRMMRVDA